MTCPVKVEAKPSLVVGGETLWWGCSMFPIIIAWLHASTKKNNTLRENVVYYLGGGKKSSEGKLQDQELLAVNIKQPGCIARVTSRLAYIATRTIGRKGYYFLRTILGSMSEDVVAVFNRPLGWGIKQSIAIRLCTLTIATRAKGGQGIARWGHTRAPYERKSAGRCSNARGGVSPIT